MMNRNPLKISEKFLRTIIERLNTDVLFECFAALLVRSTNIDPDDIHVIPKENEKRNYKNDIIPIRPEDEYDVEKYFEENKRGLHIMYTSRSAILDYLPEDFYSEPDNTDEFINERGEKRKKEDVEKYREQVKAALKSAQRFFTPLEVEYNKVRIHRALNEIEQLENYDVALKYFWKHFELSNEKWKRFIRTLHLTPFIIGDKEKTKALIEFVLGTKISMLFDIEESCEMTDDQHKELTGETKILGFNVNIGNTIYDYQEVCTLRIEGISKEEFFEYFDEDKDNKKLLNEIIKYYFPLNLDVRLDFSIQQKERKKGELAEVPILGYSSKLGLGV